MTKLPYTFHGIVDPPGAIVDSISGLAEDNPFSTPAYLEVRKVLGAKPCALYLQAGGSIVSGCFGFLSIGRMNARMEITSLPVLADAERFWQGLFQFCRDQRITVLNVHTFGSVETSIQWVGNRTSHKLRSEYRLDLTVPDLWSGMNRRHHRLIKKACSNGLEIHRESGTSAREKHVQLANLSLERRRRRGDHIDYRITLNDVNAFLDNDAGEIFQAVRGEEVFSSILIARSRKGGYAQSSGTSEEGRNLGSSHFLFYEVASLLKSEGATLFNLGGADEQSTGLQEFKLGLGSARVDLESADFYTGTPLKKYATRILAIVKSLPGFPIGA